MSSPPRFTRAERALVARLNTPAKVQRWLNALPYNTEQGGPTRSAAIILRSQRLGEGTVLQQQFDTKTGTIKQQYGPTQVPYELTA